MSLPEISTVEEGNLLRSNLDSLLLMKEDLTRKRFNLQKKIELTEAAIKEILGTIEGEKQNLREEEKKRDYLVTVRDDVDVTIEKTGQAIKQLVSNTKLLKALVEQSEQQILGVLHD